MKEKQFAENLRMQLDILQTVGNDFINIALIHVETSMCTLLKAKNQSKINQLTEYPYENLVRKSIERYVKEEKRNEILQSISLQTIVKQLLNHKEYIFEFDGIVDYVTYHYQVKYVNVQDPYHILMVFKKVDTVQSLQKDTAMQLRKERSFLDVLCRDYTSVYYYEEKKQSVQILKMGKDSNEVNLIGDQLRASFSYMVEMEKYCKTYVVEDQQEDFKKVMSPLFLREKLLASPRFVYRYESIPNRSQHRYFEIHALRINEDKYDGTAILGFRHIDDVIEMERKHVQDHARMHRLQSEKESAISANEMKSRFLSSISHDIRTPINGIQGMVSIAEHYQDDHVVDMSRLESHSIQVTEEKFNIIETLMNITSMTDIQITQQGLHSVVDWKPEYIQHRYLIGSVEGLSRILMNLNSNAIKYNKPTGTVYCRAMEKETNGNTVWFEFVNADTGIGMDEEFLKHSFEPYIQKENGSLNSINGVGLGLSIVKQTVDLMGGTIRVESKVNEGTKYTILLPFKIDTAPSVKKVSYDHISLKGVKALLVEDNQLNMEIAKFYLEQENIDVTYATNGKEAVEVFAQSDVGSFDIILMDIVMPIMDGLEATREIRALNRADAKAIPIVAMSANAFEQDIQKSLEAGMNAHLIKPINGPDITNTMKKYLANRIIK